MDTVVSKAAAQERPATAISLPASRISLASGALFVILLAALHIVKPDLDPSWSVVSEYALGEYGWIMTIAFLSLGICAVSLFVAIRSQVQTLGGRIGLIFLLVGAAGPILAAIFPMDPITTPADAITTQGAIHSMGAMLSDGILIAATLLTVSLGRKNPDWRTVRMPLILALILAWVAAVAFTGSMMVLLPRNGGQLGPNVAVGWQSRLVMLAYAAWLMTAAWSALRVRARG